MNLFYIIRRTLVYIEIQPVGVQQLPGGTPGYARRLRGIIVREIILRKIHGGKSLLHIAEIFLRKRVRIVLRMAGHEELSAVLRLRDRQASALGNGHDFQFRNRLHIGKADIRRAGVRRQENIIKSTEQRGSLLTELMREDSEERAVKIQLCLLYTSRCV